MSASAASRKRPRSFAAAAASSPAAAPLRWQPSAGTLESMYAPLPAAARPPAHHASRPELEQAEREAAPERVVALVRGHLQARGGHSETSASRNIASKLERRTLVLEEAPKARKRAKKGGNGGAGAANAANAAGKGAGTVGGRRKLSKKTRRHVLSLLKHTSWAQAQALAEAWQVYFGEHCERKATRR